MMQEKVARRGPPAQLQGGRPPPVERKSKTSSELLTTSPHLLAHSLTDLCPANMSTTLCFLPVGVGVQLLALGRMFVAKLAIFWIFFSSPSAVLTGLLGHVVHSLLLDSNLALSLLIPLLAAEMVVDTLLLVGVWRSARLCLFPWLLLNGAIICGASAGVVSLLVPAILPSLNPSQEDDITDAALEEINRSLLIILLNMLLIFQMVNVSAVVRVMVDMRRKRRVSFSGKVEKKELPPVSMYELPPPPPPTYPEDEELMEEGNSSSSFEDIPTVQSSLMENPNITITDEGTGDVTRESWNSLKFTLDKENFA